MTSEPTTEPARTDGDELQRLRDRVAALERELAERTAAANAALAAAQERSYWLERWHLDLNALMRRPLPARLWRLMPVARAGLRGVRRVARGLRKLPQAGREQ